MSFRLLRFGVHLGVLAVLLMMSSCSQEPARVEYRTGDNIKKNKNKVSQKQQQSDGFSATLIPDEYIRIDNSEIDTVDSTRLADMDKPGTTEEQMNLVDDLSTKQSVSLPDSIYQPEQPEEKSKEKATGQHKPKHGFVMPTSGSVQSKFGRNNNSFNDGVLMSLGADRAVLSVADGSIVYVGREMREYGNMIIIQHNNDVISSYSHIDTTNAKIGETVKKGQIIGHINDQKSNLLFSIRINGKAVDPIKYING